jgi:hypothetical protein
MKRNRRELEKEQPGIRKVAVLETKRRKYFKERRKQARERGKRKRKRKRKKETEAEGWEEVSPESMLLLGQADEG